MLLINFLSAWIYLLEFSSGGEKRPIRACGTRFIAQKVAALSRMIEKFGAYMNHMNILIEDPSTKSADKAKLRGYVKKWQKSEMLLGFVRHFITF